MFENFDRQLLSYLKTMSFNDLDIYNLIWVAFEYQRAQQEQKMALFSTFQLKSLSFQILLKIGCQPRVVIYIYLKELDPQMLHTKFLDNQPNGSEEHAF